jgi:hypothetical protein
MPQSGALVPSVDPSIQQFTTLPRSLVVQMGMLSMPQFTLARCESVISPKCTTLLGLYSIGLYFAHGLMFGLLHSVPTSGELLPTACCMSFTLTGETIVPFA